MCCRGAGLMPKGLLGRCQERLGTCRNPQFGAVGLGWAHAQCLIFDGLKSFSFSFHTLVMP